MSVSDGYYIMIRLIYIVVCLTITQTSEHEESADQRAKRQVNVIPLVFPYGATYKLLIGFAIPVPNKEIKSLQFAVNFQYQYIQYQNISQLSPYFFIKQVSREEREADIKRRKDERYTFYTSVAALLEAKGMNGHQCLLRAICEAAQFPFKDQGLFGEIFHILLTPDYGRTEFEEEDANWQLSMTEFVDAAVVGRQMFSCPDVYNGCPEGKGLLEMISTLLDE